MIVTKMKKMIFFTKPRLGSNKQSGFGLIVFLALAFGLSGCGIQEIPRSKNDVEASLAEVTNQYKRRADLIPNLVETVKAYAKHENATFIAVTEARSKVGSVQIDPTKFTAADVQKFQSAQGELSQALSRLMLVAEKYPDLKANQNFRDLQAQLEGTENRITVARQRQIESIKNFNNLVTVFPTSLTNSIFFKNPKMAQWDVPAGENVQAVPKVNF